MPLLDGWVKKKAGEFTKDGYLRYTWELEYHASWDALIPVIKKIKGMHFYILQKTLIMDYMKAAGAMNSGWLSLDINKAHKGVYEFLIWYNQSKQSNDTARM